MKRSLFLPLAILFLTLTSCTLIRSTADDSVPVTPAPPMTILGADVAPPTNAETVTKETTTKTPIIVGKTPAAPDNTATPKPTVSTEDLTKELDSFVDDITKGL